MKKKRLIQCIQHLGFVHHGNLGLRETCWCGVEVAVLFCFSGLKEEAELVEDETCPSTSTHVELSRAWTAFSLPVWKLICNNYHLNEINKHKGQTIVFLCIDEHKAYLSKQIVLCPACSAAIVSAVELVANTGALFTVNRSRIWRDQTQICCLGTRTM